MVIMRDEARVGGSSLQIGGEDESESGRFLFALRRGTTRGW